MMRTALRAPDGPAEVIADVLRLLAVLSIVVAAIGWGPLSGLSFLAVVAVDAHPAGAARAGELRHRVRPRDPLLHLEQRAGHLPHDPMVGPADALPHQWALRRAALRRARAARRARRPFDAAASDAVRDRRDHGARALARGDLGVVRVVRAHVHRRRDLRGARRCSGMPRPPRTGTIASSSSNRKRTSSRPRSPSRSRRFRSSRCLQPGRGRGRHHRSRGSEWLRPSS